MAKGAADDDLRSSTLSLLTAVNSYKQAAKSAKGLESQNKPKAKAKPKAEPPQWENILPEMFDFGDWKWEGR